MLTVMISPEAMRDQPARYVDLLHADKFNIIYPQNSQLECALGTEEETIEELKDVDAVIAGGEMYTQRVIAALPNLRVIARSGVGYDRVDVPAATRHGIAVTITPNANHEAVAEQTLALLFAVAKSLVKMDQATREGRWPRAPLMPVRGQTLGIVGLGRIGRSTAARAVAIGMRVIAAEVFPDEEFVKKHGIELVDFDTLLAQSDYVSLHCPLNDQTRGIIDYAKLRQMKSTSALINTARGDLVVEEDLARALGDGTLRAAGLDVFQREPPLHDHPLLRLDNVVLSPHLGGVDTLSQEQMGVEAAECIVRLKHGEWPEGAALNDELRDQWRW